MHYEQIIVLGDVQIRGSVLLGGGGGGNVACVTFQSVFPASYVCRELVMGSTVAGTTERYNNMKSDVLRQGFCCQL